MDNYSISGGMENESTIEVVPRPVDRYIVAALFSVIMSAGLFGNGLVIAAVIVSKELQSVTYAFVVALSVSDLLTMLNIPWSIVAILSTDGWPLPHWICALTGLNMIALIGFSICTMACIAVNRLLLFTISRQTFDKIFSPINTALIIVINGVFNYTVASPPVYSNFGKLGYDRQYSSCTWDKTNSNSEIFELFVVSFQYPIPLLVCITCYIKLFFVIRNQTKVMLSTQDSTGSTSAASNLRKSLSKRQMQVTKSMFYILCTFLACTVPFAIIMMSSSPGRLGPYTGCILLLNSALNPLIYATKMPHFKTDMKRVLFCRYSQAHKRHEHGETAPMCKQVTTANCVLTTNHAICF